MNKLSKEKRERLILTGLCTVIAIVALWYGLINLQRSKLAGLRDKIGEVQSDLDNARRLIEKQEQIRSDLARKQETLQTIEAGMAQSGDAYSWALNTVNNLVTNESAPYEIEMINIQAPEQGALKMIPDFPYRASTFTVTLSGHYHDFGLFLSELENSHPFVRVKRFELEPTSAASENLAINMDVVALMQPQPKP